MADIIWDNMNTSKKGAVAEYVASNWLLTQGYEVFKNITPSGKIDIIAVKSNEMHLIDVALCLKSKGKDKYSDNKKRAAVEGAHLGIKILCVLDTGECVWREELFKQKPSIECDECKSLFTPIRNELTCSDSCREIRIPRLNKAKYLAKKAGQA